MHTEAVDPYAAGAHGDHLVRGLNAGTGYAGTAAANGDTHAPTGSLPAGISSSCYDLLKRSRHSPPYPFRHQDHSWNLLELLQACRGDPWLPQSPPV